MSKLKVYVKNNQNIVKIPVGIRLLIRRCCQAVLATENFEKDAEVSVSFVTNKEIRNLNKVYRNKDTETDVLSFPLTDDDGKTAGQRWPSKHRRHVFDKARTQKRHQHHR